MKRNGRRMDKRGFVAEVSSYLDGGKAPLLKTPRVLFVLDAMLAEVFRALIVPGPRVSYWPGVGKFVASWDKSHEYMNQIKRQCMVIPARYRLRYRMSLELRKALIHKTVWDQVKEGPPRAPKIYREGMAEFRAAVKVALEVGAVDSDVTADGRWWTYVPPWRAVVATDAAIDRVIACFSTVLVKLLKSGDGLRLRDFGTFFVTYRNSFVMTGAASGVAPRRVVARFRAARGLQKVIGSLPQDIEPVGG